MNMMKLRNLHTYRDAKGEFRCYVRRSGADSIPIEGKIGSPKFMAAYRAALKSPKVKKTKRTSRAPRAEPGAYFIKCGTFIKIGYATNVSQRLAELQTGAPERLEILLTMPGPQKLERSLHSKFHPLRSQGEWFRAEEPILTFIGQERLKQERNISG